MELHAGDAVYTRVGIAVAVDIGSVPSKVSSKQCDAPFKAAGEVDIPVHEGDAHPFDGTEVVPRLP